MSNGNRQCVRLDRCCLKIGSGSTPRGGEQVYQSEGTALIRSQNIYNGVFSSEGLAFLNDEEAERLNGVTVIKDDILLNITGDSVARCCQVPEIALPARVNQHVAIVRPRPDEFDARFLKYFFISPWMQSTMLSLAGSGGTRKALTKEMIQNFEVPKPSLRVQKKIASILYAYDDLIENNRRRIALLEETARLLYQEWFIHFRFPGHENTQLIDGFPKGWEQGTIGNFYDTTSGGTPSRSNSDFYTGEINWVKTQELNDDFIFETEEKITEEAIEKSSAKIFPEDTVLISIYGGTNIGRTGILAQPSATNQACCALFPKDPRAHFIYTALFFQRHREKLISLAQGAAQTNINQQVIRALPFFLPPKSLSDIFIELLGPVFEKMKNLKRQNIKLLAARDFLLPRLMNGEIAV